MSLDGLGSLTSVGSVVSVAGNPELLNLDGLRSLSSVGGRLFIHHNRSLPTAVAETIEAQLRSHGWANEANIYDNSDFP